VGCVQFFVKTLPAAAIRKMLAGQTGTGLDQPGPCPLTGLALQSSKWELGDLKKMEKHISTQTTCQHTQLKNWVLPEPLQGSTPLLMASDKGNIESVKHIVENWGVDVNATAVYYYKYTKKSSKIRKRAGASSLFVAAYAGHLSIVRYLVAKGARVDIKTSYDDDEFQDRLYGSLAGLNPLHGALSSLEYNERLDIIRLLLEIGADPSALTSNGSPIWTMRRCDSDEVTLLIEHGMSLTQRCKLKNRTVLHHWASEDPNSNSSARVFQLLLKKGADLQARDAQNLTPVLAAAQCSRRFYFKPKFPVLNFLSKSEDIDRMEKVDVLELAGAVIISNKLDDNRYTPLAFDYWRQALHLYGTCRKTTLVFETVSYTEWSTVADLEEIENHPTQQKIHSLLAQLRIYSSISWEAFYEFFGKCLGKPDFDDAEHFRSDSLAILYYFERTTIEELEFVNGALEFWWILLEVVHQRFDIRQEKVWLFTIKLTRWLVDRHLLYLKRPHLGQLHLNSLESWKKSLTLIAKKNLINLPTDTEHRAVDVQFHLKTLCKLFSILVRLPAEILDEEVMSLLKKLVNQNYCSHHGYHLLNLSLKKSYIGWDANPVFAIIDLLLKSGANPNSVDSNRHSPIHLLLLSTKRSYFNHHISAMVDLLLKAGADPNSIDNERNGPLHLLALLQDKELDPVGHLLRDAGTHLDRANQDGKTAAELWLIARDEKYGKRAWNWSDLPDWCREDDVPNLSCLCARIVRRNGVPYKHKVPVSISAFIKIH